MAKILFWIAVVFVVLFALRLSNLAQAKRRTATGNRSKRTPAAKPMVRCARCGLYLPAPEAKRSGDGYVCGEASCGQSR